MKLRVSRHLASQMFIRALLVLAGLVTSALAQSDIVGKWTTLPYLMPINPVHVALLYNGKVLIVSGSGNLAGNTNLQTGLWDPQTGAITTQPAPWDMFCNGMATLPDGRILINGGTKLYSPFEGLPNASTYDPASNTFSNVQPTKHGRWYPTLTTLPDGRVMTFSGTNETGNGTNNAVEIYTAGSGWSPEYAAPWMPPLYPRMHVLPNGKVFYSGPSAHSALFDPSTQAWNVGIADTKSGAYRLYGSSVLLPLTPGNNYDPKVMIFGGNQPAIASTEIIDLNAANPAWQFGPSMSQPRIEMDAVLLPDGKVLAMGGSSNDEDPSTASLNADLYDPNTNSFSLAGANAFPRLYHTVALLLPDGTVWLAGGNPGDIFEQHIEIYQPAYLFTTDGHGNAIPAPRPTITDLPPAATWQASFTVETPDASDISSVVLVRPGSSTHAFDMDQRLVGLAFTRESGALTVAAPPNANIAPPGYYMLFLLNSAGVPSVAKFIQLGASNDFSISLTPTARTVNRGSSASYTVNINPFGGFSGTVNLSVSGLPAGATGTFNPDTVAGGGSSTLTIDTLDSTPLGNYVPTVTATSGGLSHAATLSLNVNILSSAPFGIDTIVSADNKTAAVNLTTGSFSTAGPNELLLAFVSTDGPAAGGMNVSTVNGGGLTWERVLRTNAQPGDAEIWRAFAIAPLSGATVTVGLSPWIVASSVTVVAFTGTDASTPNGSGAIGATGSASALAGAPSASLVTTRNNSWVFGVGTDWDKAAARTLGTNQTMVHQVLTSVGSTYWVERQNSVTPLSGTTVTLNATAPTADKYDFTIAEILPAAGSSPDFVLSSNPSSQTAQAGASVQFTATIAPVGAFTGTVTLSVSGMPVGATGTFNPPTVSGSGSSTLSISTLTSTPAGSYPLTITATSGSLIHVTNATLIVAAPDFSLAVTPSSQSVSAGGSVPYTATITNQNGFTGVVSLSVSGLPAGVTGTFSPTTITGAGVSTLTIGTSTSTIAGTYTLTVVATSGGLNHTTGITLVVTGSPDFSVTATPSSQTVQAGGGTQYTTTITAQNGFSGTVSLNVSGLPAGATGVFSPLTVAGSGTSTLTIGTQTSTPVGSYPLTLTATSGSSTHTTSVTLVVTAVSPPGQLAMDATISRDGASASTSITTPAFSTAAPNELCLAFVSTDSASTGGTTVTSVTGGGLTWALVKRTNAQPGDAEIWRAFATSALSNATVTANLSQSVASSITLVTFTGVDPSGTNGSGAVGATGGASAATGAPTASLVTTRNNSWVFAVGTDWDRPVARTLGANQAMVHQYLATVNSTYWVQRQNVATLLSGTTVTINDTAPTNDKYDLSLVEILPAAALSPDFSVTATPGSQTVVQGSNTSFAVNVGASGGFSGTVGLGVSGLPTGATGVFNPASIGTSGSSTLTISTLSSIVAGSYPLTITATSGSLSHTTGVTLMVTAAQDFSISAAPSTRTVVAGSGTTYTATVTPQGGFSGTVTLSATGLPTGATATFNPATVIGSGTSTLTVNTLSSTPIGTSTLTITGVSGSISHATTAALTVTASLPPGQLAIDISTSTDRTSANTSVTTPAFSTTAPNELLLAFVSADSVASGGLTVTGVAGGGLTWALVKRTNAQPGGAEIWRAFATTALSNATVTANLSQNVVSSITVVTIKGADSSGTNGSGAIGATAGASAVTGAPTTSLVTTRNGSWIFGVGTDWDRAVARTLGANQTMVHQFLTNVGSTYWVQRQNAPTPLSGATVTINDTAPSNDKYDLSIVEILPSP